MGVMSYKGGGGEKGRPGVMPGGGWVKGREHQGDKLLNSCHVCFARNHSGAFQKNENNIWKNKGKVKAAYVHLLCECH